MQTKTEKINVDAFIQGLHLISKKIEIIDSTNKTLKNKKYTIIEETKNMFLVYDSKNKKQKTIPKNQIIIKLNDYIIDGKLLIKRIA